MRDVLHVGEGRCREGRQREKHNFGSIFSLKSVVNKQQSSFRKGPLLSCLALSFWIVSWPAVISGGLCYLGCLWCFCLGSQEGCTQFCIRRNPCKHTRGELWAAFPLPSSPCLWFFLSSAEPSPCHGAQFSSPKAGLRGLLPWAGWKLCIAWGWVGSFPDNP